MIAHLSALSAEHDEIVELPSSPRRKEGLPPGHRGDQGEQPLHPRGGGGTPSPLVGWAGGRWPVGAQSSFCTFAPELLQLQVPDLSCTTTSSSSLCRSSLGPAAATAAERRYRMAIRGETAPSARGGCLSERVFSGGNTLSPSGCSPLTSDSGSDPSFPQRGLHLRGLESSSILVLTEGSEPQRANVAQGASSPLNPCPLERGKDGSGGSGGSGGSEIRVLKRAQGARGLRGLERPQRAATLT